MKIQILQLVEGAKKAKGLTVIIDVFRAFSLACYAFDRGAEYIIPVADIDKAYQLKKQNPGFLLIGERHEKKMTGFDFGNSPTHILNQEIKGKILIHTTSAGTQGLINAGNASELLTGSFVNAGAVVKYVRKTSPPLVSLVCMGYSALHPIEEDTFCADYIKNELEGRYTDYSSMVKVLREGSGKRFFDPDKQAYAPSTDFELCLDLNRFNFIIKAVREKDHLILRKFDIS